jgi:GNAT superfamily N-acetyltransferase
MMTDNRKANHNHSSAEQLLKNRDERLAFYELLLESPLDSITERALPKGFSFVNYKSGDKDQWIEIEKSAEEFKTAEDGEKAWAKYFEGKDEQLAHRMFFVENELGEKVATASAYYNIYAGDDGINGWLHWVAVHKKAQGKGLAKPLITHVLQYMKTLGYQKAVIPTQTTTWLACRLYLDLGFRPVPENAEHSRTGWMIIRRLTKHPSLSEFAEADSWDLTQCFADTEYSSNP